MKRYLLNVILGEEDRDLFLLCVDKEITENEMNNIFSNAIKLTPYEEININVFMEHIGSHTNGEVIEVYSNYGKLEHIDNYYMIEL